MKKHWCTSRRQRALPVILAGFLFCSPSSAAPAWAQNPAPLGKITLQLKWYHQFQFAGFYAAIEKGFYRDEGLELLLLEGDPDVGFSESVVSGKAQYGIHNSDILIERVEGRPVVVLGAIFQHSPSVMIALQSRGLERPDDFPGRTIMVSSEAEAEIYSMFISESISLDSIITEPHSWNLEDLVADDAQV